VVQLLAAIVVDTFKNMRGHFCKHIVYQLILPLVKTAPEALKFRAYLLFIVNYFASFVEMLESFFVFYSSLVSF